MKKHEPENKNMKDTYKLIISKIHWVKKLQESTKSETFSNEERKLWKCLALYKEHESKNDVSYCYGLNLQCSA